MLTSQALEQHVAVSHIAPNFCEINRVLAAAVVSRKFCALLLSDPAKAIAQGFAGEKFHLSPDEYNLILSAQRSSLAELAMQLSELANGQPVAPQRVQFHSYSDPTPKTI